VSCRQAKTELVSCRQAKAELVSCRQAKAELVSCRQAKAEACVLQASQSRSLCLAGAGPKRSVVLYSLTVILMARCLEALADHYQWHAQINLILF